VVHGCVVYPYFFLVFEFPHSFLGRMNFVMTLGTMV
jgi:hypothetical protein